MQSGLRAGICEHFCPHHNNTSIINNMCLLNIYCPVLFLYVVDGRLGEGISCGFDTFYSKSLWPRKEAPYPP